MFKQYTIRTVVKVHPKNLGGDYKQGIADTLKEKYERYVDEDMGLILSINNVRDIGEGTVPIGDGNVYFQVTFDCLAYKPQLQEVIEGTVTEISDFGAFVSLGPIDGLVHLSQVTDDFISIDRKVPMLVGRESGKKLKVGDKVRAKIVAVSFKENMAETKIGLTMRQPGLGKTSWLGE